MIRQLRDGEHVALILCRDEAGRQRIEAPARRADLRGIRGYIHVPRVVLVV